MAQRGLNPPFTDQDSFYRVVDPTKHYKKNRVKPGAFAPPLNKGLSVDWSVLTSPSKSAQRQAHRWDYAPTPVAEVSAVLVWDIGLAIRPDPIDNNDAHCEIYGSLLQIGGVPEGTSARQRLANECTTLGPFIVIQP